METPTTSNRSFSLNNLIRRLMDKLQVKGPNSRKSPSPSPRRTPSPAPSITSEHAPLTSFATHVHKRQVVIIRHGEKPPKEYETGWLSPTGEKRAQHVAKLSKRHHGFRPKHIIATKPRPPNSENDRPKSARMLQTVEPLSKHLNVEVDTSYNVNEIKQLVDSVHTLPREISPVLICWAHEYIPDIARPFCNDERQEHLLTWDRMDYDSIWIIEDGKLRIEKQGFIHSEL